MLNYYGEFALGMDSDFNRQFRGEPTITEFGNAYESPRSHEMVLPPRPTVPLSRLSYQQTPISEFERILEEAEEEQDAFFDLSSDMASTKVNARRAAVQASRTPSSSESPTKSGSPLRRHHTFRDEEDISNYREAINARTPGRLKIPAVFLCSDGPQNSVPTNRGTPNVSRSLSMRSPSNSSTPVSNDYSRKAKEAPAVSPQQLWRSTESPLKNSTTPTSSPSSKTISNPPPASKTNSNDVVQKSSRDFDSAYSSSISFEAPSDPDFRPTVKSSERRGSNISNRLPSTDVMDPKYKGYSEEELQKKLREASQFEDRRKIRSAIRCLRSEGSGSYSDYSDAVGSQGKNQSKSDSVSSPTVITDTRQRTSMTGSVSYQNGYDNGHDDEEMDDTVFQTTSKPSFSAPVPTDHPRLPSLSQLPLDSSKKSDLPSVDNVDMMDLSRRGSAAADSSCDDLEVLEKLLDDTTDLAKRRDIRATIRELRRQVREGGNTPKPPPLGQPVSVEVSEKELNGGREVIVDCKQQKDDELKNVRSVTRLERTDSQSKVQTKTTTMRSLRRTLGGTEYEELNAKIERQKVTRKGSTYLQREAIVEKRVHPPHGDDSVEKEITISVQAANKDGEEKFRESVSAHTGLIYDKAEEEEAVKPVPLVNSKPIFLAPVEDVTLDTDQVVSFKCVVQSPGDDKPLFDIFYGSRRLAVILDYSKNIKLSSIADRNFLIETTFRLTEPAHPSIEGTYKVRVRNCYGFADCSFQLTVEESSLLTLDLPLDDVAVSEGERIMLSCTVTGLLPEADVKWDTPKTASARNTRVFPQSGLIRLEIPSSRVVDCGEYTVTVRQGGQKVTSRANVEVKIPEPDPAETIKAEVDEQEKMDERCRPPIFKRSLPQQLTLCDDEDLVLSCDVDNTDRFTVIWEKDGVELQHDGKLIFIRRDEGHLEMRIRGVNADCNGSYRVVVQNPAGRRSCTAFVNVREREPVALAFSSEPKDVTVSTSEDTTLECVLQEEDSRAVAVWFLNSQPLTSRPNVPDYEQRFDGRRAELILRGLQPAHSGVYSCGVKNTQHTCICQCSVTVRPPPVVPRFNSPLSDQHIRDGDTLVLECSLAERVKDGRVTWYLNDEDISGTEGQRMEFNGTTARLVIWDAFDQDCGLYRCMITSPGGQVECKARVRMQGAKRNAKSATPNFSDRLTDLKVVVGDSTRLTATLEAPIPGARVLWTFRGRPAAGVSNFDGQHASLVIGPLSERQSGLYAIRITSADGERWCESTCNISVEPPKPKMSDVVDVETCCDEEALTKLLAKTDNMDKRRQIRARLKEIREHERKRLEERRKAREQGGNIDAVRSRQQMADDEKARKMKAYQEQAKAAGQGGPKTDAVKAMADRAAADKEHRMKTFDELAKAGGPVAFQGGLDSVKKMEQAHADQEKQRALQQFSNMQKDMASKATSDKPIPRVHNKGGQSGHTYGTRAEEAASLIADRLHQRMSGTGPASSGSVTVRTEAWNSHDKVVRTDESSATWGQRPVSGPPGMNAFKQMDKAANPDGPKKPNMFKVATLIKSQTPKLAAKAKSIVLIKQQLLYFCTANTAEYQGVNITNFGSSWSDGLAFCALIHHFVPDAFDFSSLKPENRRENFQLAFDTAEKRADICPLLDVDDMVMMKVPDWKCVFTQIQSYYRRFRDHERNVLRSQERKSTSEQ